MVNEKLFGDPNRISPETAAEMAWLAEAAYDDSGFVFLAPKTLSQNLAPHGWTALGADELGLSQDSFDSHEFYSRGTDAQGFAAAKGNTLVISFRGTQGVNDLLTDIWGGLPWSIGFAGYYASLQPLIVHALAYANRSDTGIDKILVCGHSLGGAAVERFAHDLADYGPVSANIAFLTLGSPGTLFTDDLGSLPDVIQVGHTQDPVKNLAIDGGVERFVDQGRPVYVDLPNVNPGLWNEHSSSLYVRTIEYIGNSDLYICTTTSTRVVALYTDDYTIRNDNYTSSQSNVLVLGLQGSDLLSGSSGADLLDGGLGKDSLNGSGGNDSVAGGLDDDWLIGGNGADLLFGGADADNLIGGAGNDTLWGDGPNINNDYLSPTGYSDTLTGGLGNDSLYGGVGSDNYVFLAGDGNDVINEEGHGGWDNIDLKPVGGEIVANIAYAKSGNDIRLTFRAADSTALGSILIKNQGAAGSAVEHLTVWDVNGPVAGVAGNIDLVQKYAGAPDPDPDNKPPTVTGPTTLDWGLYRTVSLSGLWSIQDPNSSADIGKVIFWDSTPGAGHLTLDGVQASVVEVASLADLGRVAYVTGGEAGTNQILIEAFDASGAGSNQLGVTLRIGGATLPPVVGNQAPVVTGPSVVDVPTGSLLWGWQLFGQIVDPDGASDLDHITFWDYTPGAGQITLNGVPTSKAEVTPDQLWRIAYIAGNTPGLNDVVVVAYDKLGAASSDLRVTVRVGGTFAANVMLGTAGNDVLTGTAGNDLIRGLNGNDSLTGADGNDTLDGGIGDDTLKGGNGDDTYIVDDSGDVVTETSGIDTVEACITYTLGSYQENLMLTGSAMNDGAGNELANVINGNGAANVLKGGEGNDTLIGGDGNDLLDTSSSIYGNDSLVGGAGNDTLFAYQNDTLDGGAGDDLLQVYSDQVYSLQGGSGTDTLAIASSYWYSGAFSLAANGIEVINGNDRGIYGTGVGEVMNFAGITLNQVAFIDGRGGNDTISGFTAAVFVQGDVGDDSITGSVGSDTLEGSDGNDTLIGGAGNDLLNNASSGSGDDSLDGGTGNDTLKGGEGNDTLIGGDGNDLLDTSSSIYGNDSLVGGAGNDTLFAYQNDTLDGGAGDDLLQVYSDQVYSLQGGSGTDTLAIASSYWYSGAFSLAANGIEVINGNDRGIYGTGVGEVMNFAGITLNQVAFIDGRGGNDTLTGSVGNDTIKGGDGNDALNGSTGADSLIGGLGDDIYVVDNAGDVVAELASQGTDTIQTNRAYTLGSNIDKLLLTGTGNVTGIGNELANTLTGNGANNTLNGGTGADTMIGRAGDDTYVVDNAGDRVTEGLGQGTDTAKSSVSLALAVNVEKLILTGAVAVNGTGNALANTLTGNGANNTLSGGAGNDTLTGGTGADAFKFATTAEGVDSLTDFTSGSDRIQVASANFGFLALGPLAADRFLVGTAPANRSAVFLYNAATGALSFDNNGNGAGGISQIATLTGSKNLLFSDIQVVAA
jgi:Ca2+-binding RTX toxin-like protein